MTMIFFSHNFRGEIKQNFNVDIQSAWYYLPGVLMVGSIAAKLFSVVTSRYTSIFSSRAVDNAFVKKIPSVVYSISDQRVEQPLLTPIARDLALTPNQSKRVGVLLGKDVLKQNYVNKPAATMTSTIFSVHGLLDASLALLPSAYFGFLVAMLLHITAWSGVVPCMIMGFLFKIPCSIVYYRYRVPANVEFFVLLSSFIKYGLPQGYGFGSVLCLGIESFFTAIVDGSSVFFPSFKAMSYYSNVSLSTDHQSELSAHSSLCYWVAALSATTYTLTSFGNTYSSSFSRCGPSSRQSSRRCCDNFRRQPIANVSAYLGLAYAWFISFMALMFLMRKVAVLPNGVESFQWSANRIAVTIISGLLAVLPTRKSWCYTVPKVLEGSQIIYKGLTSFFKGCFDPHPQQPGPLRSNSDYCGVVVKADEWGGNGDTTAEALPATEHNEIRNGDIVPEARVVGPLRVV